MLDDWVAQHDFATSPTSRRTSRRRCCRPALRRSEAVGEAQVDQSGATSTTPRPTRRLPRASTSSRAAAPPRPVHPAGRRDGLRRGLPGDGDARVRPPRQPGAHPAADQHRPRRHEPAIDLPRRRRAGAGDAIGEVVGRASRSDAGAGDRPLGRIPLDRARPRSAASTSRSSTRRSAGAG